MSFTFWLASLKARVTAASAKRRHGNSRRTTARQRSLRLETLEERLVPATLIVNTLADNTLADSVLSLREAILLVNNNGNAITALDRSLTSGEASQVSGTFGANDKIEFSSAFTAQTITLEGSALALNKSVTIIGLGTGLGASNAQNDLAVSGNYQSGVFTVAAGAQVSITGLYIENGQAADGGGIANSGTLTVSNSFLEGNQATGGSFGSGGGGAIYNAGTLTVSNSFLAVNYAITQGNEGGGIYSAAGTVTVSNSTLQANTASIAGGGIHIDSGTVTVLNSTLAYNKAVSGSEGGTIDNGGTLAVVNSTLGDNSATFGGGGIYNYGLIVTVINSTLGDNSASLGGGIDNDGGLVTLNNSVVANSTSGSDLAGGGAFTGSYDLIGDGSRLSSFSHALQGNPLLGALGDNGGPTQTMALLPGSSALDAGSNALAVDANGHPLNTDQRGAGFARISGPAVDLGAFEVQVDYAVAAIAGSGIWRYSSVTGWQQVWAYNGDSAALVAVDDFGNVYATFHYSAGLFRFQDLTHYQLLNAKTPSLLSVSANGTVAADFAGSGVWRYTDATSWQQMTPADAYLLGVDNAGRVTAAFHGQGVYRFQDPYPTATYQHLSVGDPYLLSVDAEGDLAADFAGSGVWRYEDATGWQRYGSPDAASLSIAGNGLIAADFAGQGLWLYGADASYQHVWPTDSGVQVDNQGDVYAEFSGSGGGLYRFQDASHYQRLNAYYAYLFAVDNL